jgi:hypothetical protein
MVEGVQLAMWVVDGGSDVTTGILEDEDTGRI